MKTRIIKPTYWTNVDLQTRLTSAQREFYIGLWMSADDAGYVAWDMARLGAELYPFTTPAWRRKHLPAWLQALHPHAQLLSCGKHVVIPNFKKHNGGLQRPSSHNQRAHDVCLHSANGTR